MGKNNDNFFQKKLLVFKIVHENHLNVYTVQS